VSIYINIIVRWLIVKGAGKVQRNRFERGEVGQIPKSAQGNAHIVVGLDELDGAQTRVSGQDVLVHGLAWRHYTGNLMVDQTRENHCTHRTKKSTGSFRVFGYWPEGVIRVNMRA
jgi:hypothetical protein